MNARFNMPPGVSPNMIPGNGPDEWTEAEQREIEAGALQDLAEATYRRYSQARRDYEEWLTETFGDERDALRITSGQVLAKLWAQMHRAAESSLWTQQLVRTQQEWRELV